MQISKLIPSGFCYGVQRSIDKINSIINEYPSKQVFLLGWLVHNKQIIDNLIEQGVNLLDDAQTSRYDLVKSLPKTTCQDIIILSAHGTDSQTIDLAKQKGYQVFDLTCPFVYKTHLLINNKLNQDYSIIFIGKKYHPETLAILKINPTIKLVTNVYDIENLNLDSKKIFCTNQTTLSIFEIKELIDQLKIKYPTIEFVNDICDATTKRQEALIQQAPNFDLIFIVGDKKSSNANELLKIANEFSNGILITKKDDIALPMLENKQRILVACAASCPESLVDDVIEYLKGLKND